MRGTLFFSALLLLCSVICSDAEGQSFGPYNLSGTQCLAVSANSRATATYQVLGSWTGTIQPQIAISGQAAVNGQATPANSTLPAATITANGAYFTSVSGYSTFLLCGASVTGTATIYLNLSTAAH